MTTKKQRREQTAARTAARREAERQIGLEAQRIDREKRERREYDAKRAETKKATALKMRKQHEAAEAKKVTEADGNLYLSVTALNELAQDIQQRAYEDAVGVLDRSSHG